MKVGFPNLRQNRFLQDTVPRLTSILLTLTLTRTIRPLSLGAKYMKLSYDYWRLNKFLYKMVKHGTLRFVPTYQGT